MSLQKLSDIQFQLKMTSKQLARLASRCEKDQKKEMEKALHAMEKKNMDGARIFSENSIRKKNESLANLRLSARLDAVVSRLDSAIKMKMVTKCMGQTVRGMDKVLASMDIQKISEFMDRFEKQFDTLDVTSTTMVNAIGNASASTVPQSDVDHLMMQIADANDLDIKQYLNEEMRINTAAPINENGAQQQKQEEEKDDLERMFAQFRGA